MNDCIDTMLYPSETQRDSWFSESIRIPLVLSG